MGKPLDPNDGRLKANRDARKAQIEIIRRRGFPPNIEPFLRAKRDKKFQAFLYKVMHTSIT